MQSMLNGVTTAWGGDLVVGSAVFHDQYMGRAGMGTGTPGDGGRVLEWTVEGKTVADILPSLLPLLLRTILRYFA